jgi:uncharacterized protein
LSVYLLDVNVLVALVRPEHVSHEIVQGWFSRHSRQGWATCPLTESGMVRIISNPAFSSTALSPQQALKLLVENLSHRHHEFWPDTLGFDHAIAPFLDRVVRHGQITDAYLLGMAIHKRGTLVTLDRGMASLLPQHHPGRPPLEIIH